jgi:hypothetical protein
MNLAVRVLRAVKSMFSADFTSRNHSTTANEKPSVEPTYLNVPFQEKDQAKALGAKWNAREKRWYVPAGASIEGFSRWLEYEDEVENEDEFGSMKVCAPIYLLETFERCWKCNSFAKVFALACHKVEETGGFDETDNFVVLNSINTVPDLIVRVLRDVSPSLRFDYSKQANQKYVMNHCSCGAKLGDFYMHHEPGGAFFPTDDREAALITMRTIVSDGSYEIDASYSACSDNLIWESAKRA